MSSFYPLKIIWAFYVKTGFFVFSTRFSKGKIWLKDWGMVADWQEGVNNFFCAQLLHFSRDFNQTFTEALSSSALAHIVSVLRFKYFFGRIMALCNISWKPRFCHIVVLLVVYYDSSHISVRQNKLLTCKQAHFLQSLENCFSFRK